MEQNDPAVCDIGERFLCEDARPWVCVVSGVIRPEHRDESKGPGDSKHSVIVVAPRRTEVPRCLARHSEDDVLSSPQFAFHRLRRQLCEVQVVERVITDLMPGLSDGLREEWILLDLLPDEEKVAVKCTRSSVSRSKVV